MIRSAPIGTAHKHTVISRKTVRNCRSKRARKTSFQYRPTCIWRYISNSKPNYMHTEHTAALVSAMEPNALLIHVFVYAQRAFRCLESHVVFLASCLIYFTIRLSEEDFFSQCARKTYTYIYKIYFYIPLGARIVKYLIGACFPFVACSRFFFFFVLLKYCWCSLNILGRPLLKYDYTSM